MMAALIVTAVAAVLASGTAGAQTIIKRSVMGSGAGRASGGPHTAHGTIAQTAVGRLRYNAERHDVGFWYWGYRPTVVTTVSLPHLEAQIGTRVRFPMDLSIAGDAPGFFPRDFRARIRFNHTLLHPAGTTPACEADTGDCVLTLEGTASGEGTIAMMEFTVALGDSEATRMVIEEFTWTHIAEERIATVREHGSLALLGVCREGGQIRLVHSGEFVSRVRATPNPAPGRTVLEYVAAEDGPADIRLFDLLGNEVARLVEGNMEAERLYRTEVDLGSIASGPYVIVYRTATQAINERLLITR